MVLKESRLAVAIVSAVFMLWSGGYPVVLALWYTVFPVKYGAMDKFRYWSYVVDDCDNVWKDMSGCDKTIQDLNALCSQISSLPTGSSPTPSINTDDPSCVNIKNDKLRNEPAVIDHPSDEEPVTIRLNSLSRLLSLCPLSTILSDSDCQDTKKSLDQLCTNQDSVLEAGIQECSRLKEQDMKDKPREFKRVSPYRGHIPFSETTSSTQNTWNIVMMVVVYLCCGSFFCVSLWGFLAARSDYPSFAGVFICMSSLVAGCCIQELFSRFQRMQQGAYQDLPLSYSMIAMCPLIVSSICMCVNAYFGYQLYCDQSAMYAKSPELQPIVLGISEAQPQPTEAMASYGAV